MTLIFPQEGIGENIFSRELAKAAGLEVENGIWVDEFLRTKHPDFYAAGDVAAFYNPDLEKRLRCRKIIKSEVKISCRREWEGWGKRPTFQGKSIEKPQNSSLPLARQKKCILNM